MTDETPTVSILIADDHVLLAEAIGSALSAPPRNYNIKIATTLDETLTAIATGDAFDLVMLDLKMPGMMGLKSVDIVMKAALPSQVVLLSGNAEWSIVNAAVANGARGLIPKTLSVKSLISVVELVLSGQIFLPADELRDARGGKTKDGSKLNDREIGILRLTSEGLTNKEIAASIGSSEVNVKMHMRSICSKLNARNRAHAVTISNERGWL